MAKVILDSLIKHMTRGILIKKDELDLLTSETPTNIKYLLISNMEDGLISDSLQSLTKLEKGFDRYLVHNNDLLITKFGSPHKVIVAQIEDDKKIIVSGNIFSIQLDLSQVDPFYLASFFNSDEGKEKLQEVSNEKVLSCIKLNMFKNMEIDLPNLEEQKAIGREYLDLVNKISAIKNELNENIEKLNHIL